MVEKTLNAFVRETKESAFAVEISVEGHIFTGDEPIAEGGKDLGPGPHALLLASLGECTAITVRWYAQRHDIPLDAVDVTLTYLRDRVEGRSGSVDVFTKAVHLDGPALTPEQRAKLLDVAEKCPIQKLMEGTPVIRTSERV